MELKYVLCCSVEWKLYTTKKAAAAVGFKDGPGEQRMFMSLY